MTLVRAESRLTSAAWRIGGLGDGTKASADLQTAIGIDPSCARMVKINHGDAPTAPPQ